MAEVSAASPERSVRCPRCGYDQRGVVAMWADACPVEGVCAECGLLLDWPYVFNPRLTQPRWCVEYGRRSAILWRGFRTALMSFWPWRFWWALQMTHQPRWRRIIWYLIVWVLLLYLTVSVAQACIAWRLWSSTTQGFGPGCTSSVSQLEMTIQSFLLPISQQSPGTFASSRYPSLGVQSFNSPASNFSTFWPMPFGLLGWLSLMMAFGALGFMALPQSRSIAKVRWSHIGRIMSYGLFLPVPALIVYGLAILLAEQIPFLVVANGGIVWLLLIVPWQWIWWSTATGRYLKMRHAWGVGAAVVIMAMLASTFVIISIGLALDGY